MYLRNLKPLVDQGKVSKEQLDSLVRPILVAKVRLGLFEHPYATADTQTHAQMLSQHRAQARTVVAETAVLLRNQGGLLPLAKSVKRVAVIGPLADSQIDANGPWSLTAKPEDTITILKGLREKLPNSTIEYEQGAEIAKAYPSMFDPLFFHSPALTWTAAQSQEHMNRQSRRLGVQRSL